MSVIPIQRIQFPFDVLRVCSLLSSGCPAVASACFDGHVYVHDVHSGRLIAQSAKLGRQAWSVCADAEGNLLAGTFNHSAIHSINAADGSSNVVVPNLPDSVIDLVFIKSLNAVSAYFDGGTVRIFSLTNWAQIIQPDGCAASGSLLEHIALSP